MPSEERHAEYIKKVVDAAPPFKPEKRARLQVLLAPAAIDRRADNQG